MKQCLLVIVLAFMPGPVLAADADAPLQFRITEGDVLNAFHQQGDVAAHLLLSSGEKPRILVAFPAGNSGVGVWFEYSAQPVTWALGKVAGSERKDAGGRTLRGIVAEAEVQAPDLVVRDAVLGSVRVLRDYQLDVAYPPEAGARPRIDGNGIRWKRDRLDGAPGYEIELQLLSGQVRGGDGKPLVLVPARKGAPIRLRITALTGETPLTPLAPGELLNSSAGNDEHARQALRFLSYREKFLAGSWRFDTYFGRDTLMSLRLLMPALQPEAIEDGLASVLERLNLRGEVAHEEDIGEFAVLRHRKEGGSGDAPIYDYGMIDDDYMLAPVAAAYLLDTDAGRKRASAFLARKTSSGETLGAALVRNFDFVLSTSRTFAQNPAAGNLVAIKPGRSTGQWRDSENGLAGGRYAYDVNAVWIPTALSAIARIQAQGQLAQYAATGKRPAFAAAEGWAEVWSKHAPALFAVDFDAVTAREKVRDHAAKTGVDAGPALASLPDGSLRFAALSLDAQQRPIPVLHSDVGFALLFADPPVVAVDAMVNSALRPFPAGLLTDIGMVSANPAYAGASVQALFGNNAYHGTGVWSWQQALMAAGLQRQLARRDLPAPVRTRLRDAQTRLWKAIDASSALRTSELWSWSYANGRYTVVPFGQGRDDVDESNAAQLWSTVYLAIPRP